MLFHNLTNIRMIWMQRVIRKTLTVRLAYFQLCVWISSDFKQKQVHLHWLVPISSQYWTNRCNYLTKIFYHPNFLILSAIWHILRSHTTKNIEIDGIEWFTSIRTMRVLIGVNATWNGLLRFSFFLGFLDLIAKRHTKLYQFLLTFALIYIY